MFIWLYTEISGQSCYYFADSTQTDSNIYCADNKSVALRIHGKRKYISSGDSVSIHVYWMYGDSLEAKIPLTYINFNTATYDTTLIHNYNMNGITNIKLVLEKNTVSECTKILQIGLFSGCDTIQGQTILDLNQDCILNLNDSPLENQTVALKDTLGNIFSLGISDSSGHYTVRIPSNYSSYKLQKTPVSPTYKVYCPDSGLHNLDTVASISQSLNFSERCDTSLNYMDLRVSFIQQNVGAPNDTGQLTFNTIGYFNCNVDSSLIAVRLHHGQLLNFLSVESSIQPDSIVDTIIYWNYYQKNREITQHIVKFITDSSATFLDSVFVKAEVDTVVGETYHLNNQTQRKTRILASWDPNNKISDPQGIGINGLTERNQKMTYTINFQNLGTAPAKNIYILDTIDANLDFSSFNLLFASHSIQVNNPAPRILRFDFENINLVDSATNEPLSKGFLTYTIDMTPNLPIGSKITNQAHIYFDYNSAVSTNRTLNTIYKKPYLPISLNISAEGQDVTCMNNDNGSATVKINTSELPYSILWSNGSKAKTIKNLSPGKYYVSVSDTFGQLAVDSVLVGENRIYDDPLIGPISGPLSVQSWKSYTYSVEANAQASYLWSADGGEVLQSIANSAQIQWNAGPEGTITVTKTSDKGCYADTNQIVPILFVGIDTPEEFAFILFPNPTDGIIEIQLKELRGSDRIEILDLQGRVVYTKNLNNTSTQIDLSALANGAYTVRMIGEDVFEERTMVKR